MLRALAVLNGLPPPPDKWLLYTAGASEKRPPQLRELLERALLAAEPSAAELRRRTSAVEQLAGWVRAQLE